MKGIGGRHVVLNRILCVCVCVFAGDQRIVFSDIVIKINKRNKMQERILLITEAAIYNIDPGNFKVKRRIPISSVGGIKLSKLPDNFFCLHVPSEYDYLLVSSRKTEIVTNVIQYYEAATKSKLPVSFSNRYALWTSLWSMRLIAFRLLGSFDYKIDQDMYREIQFSSAEGGVSTQIFTKKMDKKK